jgi:phosphopantetheinyl transferase (holo-ACP synthase)
MNLKEEIEQWRQLIDQDKDDDIIKRMPYDTYKRCCLHRHPRSTCNYNCKAPESEWRCVCYEDWDTFVVYKNVLGYRYGKYNIKYLINIFADCIYVIENSSTAMKRWLRFNELELQKGWIVGLTSESSKYAKNFTAKEIFLRVWNADITNTYVWEQIIDLENWKDRHCLEVTDKSDILPCPIVFNSISPSMIAMRSPATPSQIVSPTNLTSNQYSSASTLLDIPLVNSTSKTLFSNSSHINLQSSTPKPAITPMLMTSDSQRQLISMVTPMTTDITVEEDAPSLRLNHGRNAMLPQFRYLNRGLNMVLMESFEDMKAAGGPIPSQIRYVYFYP